MNLKRLLPIIAVTFMSILCIVISIFSLKSGQFIIFQNIFYIPIIISCFYYKKKGFAISVALSCSYFFLIIAFTSDAMIIRDAAIRTILFIFIAAVITFLSISRAQVEAELLESDERFRRLADAAWEGIIIHREGIILDANESILKMFGYHNGEIIGHSVLEFLAPESIAPALQKLRESIDTHQIYFEAMGLRKDKTAFPIEVSGRPIKYKNIDARVLAIGDITERKEQLADIQMKSMLLDSATDSIFVMDLESNFRYVNESAYKSRGYSREELLAINLQGLDDPAYVKAIPIRLDEIIEKGKAVFESAHIRKDGSVIQVEIHARPVEMNGQMFVLSIARDITNRKRMEEALRETEERCKSIVGSVKLGITQIDKNHKIIMANEYFAELFNKPEAYFVGKYCFMEFEKREAICPHCPGTLSMASRESAEVETEGILDDGSRFNALIRTVPTFTSDGTVSGFIEVVEDITERKRAANALDEERRRLQQALDEVRTLRGIVPICANCKKIRDDKGYWNQVEKYVSEYTEAEFSHGICPDCAKRLYPELYEEKKIKDLERLVILLVDDEEDFRMIFIRQIKRILKDHEFEFIEASDGEEALELLRGGAKPSIIILDYAMPKINGVELLRRIDSDHNYLYDVPRIMISGYTQKEIISEAQRLRCVFFERNMDNTFYQQICQYMTNTLVFFAHKIRDGVNE